MDATYNGQLNAINPNHRKEKAYTESYLLLSTHNDTIEELAELRLYNTNSRCYACLWVHCNWSSTHTSGSGWAGGYGYHRPSEAAANAIYATGIVLSEPIDGRGDGAIREALLAIGKLLAPARSIHVAHAHA